MSESEQELARRTLALAYEAYVQCKKAETDEAINKLTLNYGIFRKVTGPHDDMRFTLACELNIDKLTLNRMFCKYRCYNDDDSTFRFSIPLEMLCLPPQIITRFSANEYYKNEPWEIVRYLWDRIPGLFGYDRLTREQVFVMIEGSQGMVEVGGN